QHPDVIGVLPLVAELLADDAVLGEVIFDDPPHHRFAGAVSLRGGLELLGSTLVLDRQRGAEERQNDFAGSGRKAPDEGGKVDDRHVCSVKVLARKARALMVAMA